MNKESDSSIRMWPIPESEEKIKTNDEFIDWAAEDVPPHFNPQQIERFNEIRKQSNLSLIGYNQFAEVWATDENWARRDLIILGPTSFEPGDQGRKIYEGK